MPGRVRDACLHFVHDDGGQDILEYALLSAFIAFAGLAAFQALSSGIGNAYTTWDTNISSDSMWASPEPGAGGS